MIRPNISTTDFAISTTDIWKRFRYRRDTNRYVLHPKQEAIEDNLYDYHLTNNLLKKS